MPINPQQRWFYPIDWLQLSAAIRFKRAKGRCEACRRPHGKLVCHLGNGRWWDPEASMWRDGQGRVVPDLPPLGVWKKPILTTRVFLACAHLDRNRPLTARLWQPPALPALASAHANVGPILRR